MHPLLGLLAIRTIPTITTKKIAPSVIPPSFRAQESLDSRGRLISQKTSDQVWGSEMDSHCREHARYLSINSGRIGKQCRERWHNHLNPDINKE